MKKLLLVSFTVSFLAFGAAAQTAPKSVTDFYLAFPADQYSTAADGKKIRGKASLTRHRRSLIKVEDVKNGYLRLEGFWEGWAEIALFKKKDGSYLIAQAEAGCGPACDGFIKFFTYKAGKWTDVTKSIFTEPSVKAVAQRFNSIKSADDEAADESGFPFYYVLPREGRIMRVACNECSQSGEGDDTTIFEYEWNGTKFVKK